MVKYMLATASTMQHLPTWYGHITTPKMWGIKPIEEGRTWCMDNGIYTNAFTPKAFTKHLQRLQPHATTCAFVAAPDVLYNAEATLKQYPEWAETIKSYGYPPALVAQDGMKPQDIPPNAPALFVGGSTEWKLGPEAASIITTAKTRGMWIHVGRVNSNQRIRRFQLMGVHSVDGTYHAFAGLENTVAHFNKSLSEKPIWSDITC